MKIHALLLVLSTLFALLVPTIVCAQKISLKDVELNLSLQDYRLEDIIDGTADDNKIGYAYKGMVNSTLKPIYFDDSIEDEFQDLFKPVFSKSADAIPLVIKLNSIQVNEWAEISSPKINLTSVSISIFQQIEEDQYILVADRIINDYITGSKASKDIGANIGKAVDRAFDYLELYVDTNKPKLTWTELWEHKTFQGLPHPKTAGDLKIYEHYSDYRQNRPMESSTLSLVQKGKRQTLLNESNEHPRDAWGYSLDGNLCINVGNKFLPLQRTADGYATNFKSVDRGDLLEGLSMWGISKVISVITLIGAGNNYDLPLSEQTGFLDIKSIYDLELRKDRTALGQKAIIEFAPFGKPGDVLDIKNNDQLLIQLSKGDFFEVPSNLETTELQACIGERCTSILLEESPMHRVVFKKGRLTQEAFSEKEKLRYLRNVDLKYWVLY